MMATTMDMNGFSGGIGGLHLDKLAMASETDDLLDVWDSDLQQVGSLLFFYGQQNQECQWNYVPYPEYVKGFR